jgi:hypothetical protein
VANARNKLALFEIVLGDGARKLHGWISKKHNRKLRSFSLLQWFALTRKHARLVVEDVEFYERFKSSKPPVSLATCRFRRALHGSLSTLSFLSSSRSFSVVVRNSQRNSFLLRPITSHAAPFSQYLRLVSQLFPGYTLFSPSFASKSDEKKS